MTYLLDTNVWVDYLNGRHPGIVRRIQEGAPADFALSSVVVAELRYGADRSARPKANHARVDVLVAEIPSLEFDLDAAAEYGRLRTRRETRGTPIGPNDMLIAAQALSRGLTLVTDNVGEFRRVKGLKVENWRGRERG
jgi:tRNA(fMet)-specific endonuclease VapC